MMTMGKSKNCMSCRLKKKIEFQTITETPNVSGGLTQAYTTFRKVSAEVIPVSGNSYLLGRQVDEKPTHKIMIRYTPDIQKDLFIKLVEEPGKPYRLLRILGDIENVEERNAFLIISAKEIQEEDA